MSSTRQYPPVVTTRRVPNDSEATLELARLEAKDRLSLGEKSIHIRKARVRLPSGVKGERYYCLSDDLAKFFTLSPAETVEIVP